MLAYRDYRLDEVVVYASTQTPHTVRVAIAEILGIEERCIRVVAPDVGGGFGPKARLYPEEIILAALALELDFPVRWIEDRREHLLTAAHTRDHHYQVTAYADRQGRFSASMPRSSSTPAPTGCGRKDPIRKPTWRRGPCRDRTRSRITGRSYTVATNKTPLGPYRGVGRPGACFVIERLIDEVARASGATRTRCGPSTWSGPTKCRSRLVGGMRLDTGDYAPACGCAPNCWTCRRSVRGSSGASPTAD